MFRKNIKIKYLEWSKILNLALYTFFIFNLIPISFAQLNQPPDSESLNNGLEINRNSGCVAIGSTGENKGKISQTLNCGLSEADWVRLEKLFLTNAGKGVSPETLSNIVALYQEQLEGKEFRISELEADVEEKAKKIREILDDENVSDEIKKLVAAGDIAAAEKLVDSRDTKRQAEEEKLASEHYERGRVKELALKYKDARTSYEIAATLQPQNSDYLNQAGLINQTLANHKKAIEYFEQGLKIDIEIHGEEHSNVSTFRNNLGGAYSSLGQYNKAIEYYNLALESDLKTYGEDHPSVAVSRFTIGLAYHSLGQYEKAIEYFNLALESNLKTYEEDSYSVANIRHNLGAAYVSLGQYEKAIEYLNLALESYLKTFGEDHPDATNLRNYLGAAYKSLGQYEKAIEYFNLALESHLKTFGEDHSAVARDRNNLGGVYYSLGQFEQATEYYRQALETLTKILGEDHPNTKVVEDNLKYIEEKLAAQNN